MIRLNGRDLGIYPELGSIETDKKCMNRYTLLSEDLPILESKINYCAGGSTAYCTDTEKTYVFDAETKTWSEDTGGGSSVTVEPVTIKANGVTTAPDGTAYSPVTVNVPLGNWGIAVCFDSGDTDGNVFLKAIPFGEKSLGSYASLIADHKHIPAGEYNAFFTTNDSADFPDIPSLFYTPENVTVVKKCPGNVRFWTVTLAAECRLMDYDKYANDGLAVLVLYPTSL